MQAWLKQAGTDRRGNAEVEAAVQLQGELIIHIF